MNDQDHVTDLLPFYAAGTLEERQRQDVDCHLEHCAACRRELRLWFATAEVVVAEEKTLPQLPHGVLDSALTRVVTSHVGLLPRAGQLLRAQTRLLRREIWLSSALVMAIGYVLALVASGSRQSGGVITAIAPLIAAAGVAMIYGPENDPALELALSTPTSPWQVLIARLLLVFGYDLLLALLATAGLLAVMPVDLLGAIILDWLGPMTFLAALTLILSLRLNTSSAVTIALLAWLTRWLARGTGQGDRLGTDFGAGLGFLAQGYESVWANSILLLALGTALVLLALLVVSRQEAALRHGGAGS